MGAHEQLGEWQARVAGAAARADADELRILFAAGREMLGDRLGEEWARALSAYDGTAVTG